MKRFGHLFEKVYDIENLKLAHKNAKKGKRFYKEVKMVDSDEEYYLGWLSYILRTMNIKHQNMRCLRSVQIMVK